MDNNYQPPHQMFSKYKQYKNDTEAIAGWLAENAIKCGYYISTPVLAATSGASTRLKGKARKEARKGLRATQRRRSNTAKDHNYTIRVSDFVQMANIIANHKPRIRIPKSLDKLFERAIQERRKCTQWFKEHAHGDYESNEQHEYFATTLDTAWETLNPIGKARTSQQKDSVADDGKDLHPNNLSNPFSVLDVQEVLDESEPIFNESHEDSYHLETPPARIVQDESQLESEFFFTMYTFFQELNVARDTIRIFWERYLRGKMDLAHASVLTNTYIHLARQAERELDSVLQRPKKYPASKYPVWTLPGLFMWECHGDEMAKPGYDKDLFVLPSRVTHIEYCTHTEFCFWHTYQALKENIYSIGESGGRLSLARIPDNYHGPLTSVYRRICDMVTSFGAVSKYSLFANDEVTRGIGFACKSSTVPIWVTFGLRILLDIQDMFKEDLEIPLEELKTHTRTQLAALRNPTFIQTFSTSDAFQTIIRTTRVINELGEIVLSDKLGRAFAQKHMTSAVVSEIGLAPPGQAGPEFIFSEDFLLLCNPLRCGILKHYLYLQLYQLSAKIELSTSPLTLLMHLYVAGRLMFPEDPVWPDMELLMQSQDIEHLFFGGLPRSLPECKNKYLLAIGMPVISLLPNIRSRPKPNSQNGRYVLGVDRFDIFFLDSMNFKDPGDLVDESMPNLLTYLDEPKVRAQASRRLNGNKDTFPELPEPGRAKMHTVVRTIDHHFKSRAKALYFDWLTMERTCDLIWDRIFANMDNQIQRPVYAAFDILDDAARAGDAKNSKNPEPLDNSKLALTWNIIQSTWKENSR